MKNNWLGILVGILVISAILIIVLIECKTYPIEELTDKWIEEVVVNHSPTGIAKLFCNDAILLGTVSQTIRKGSEITDYFEYFANLPGIEVVSKEYKISKVTNNVYINTAFITWKWDSIPEPITARMTFVYRENCIFQLHSSSLPEINSGLKSK
jgi:hypothetical protein